MIVRDTSFRTRVHTCCCWIYRALSELFRQILGTIFSKVIMVAIVDYNCKMSPIDKINLNVNHFRLRFSLCIDSVSDSIIVTIKYIDK